MSNAQNFSIQDAIAAAQKAAGEASYEANGALTPQTGFTEVSNVTKGPNLSLADVLSDGLSVDAWLKVNHFGIELNGKLLDKIKVAIDLPSMAFPYTIRYGNPVKYRKSYDRQTDSQGGSWANSLMNCQKSDPKAAEYRSAEIPCVLAEEIVTKDKTYPIGTVVGYTTPMTGWRFFESWIRTSVARAGIDPATAMVSVTLVHKPMANDKGKWGVIEFVDTQQIDQMPDASDGAE